MYGILVPVVTVVNVMSGSPTFTSKANADNIHWRHVVGVRQRYVELLPAVPGITMGVVGLIDNVIDAAAGLAAHN